MRLDRVFSRSGRIKPRFSHVKNFFRGVFFWKKAKDLDGELMIPWSVLEKEVSRILSDPEFWGYPSSPEARAIEKAFDALLKRLE